MIIIRINLINGTYLAGIYLMSESNLKKQINNLRNTLFDKDKSEDNDMRTKSKKL